MGESDWSRQQKEEKNNEMLDDGDIEKKGREVEESISIKNHWRERGEGSANVINYSFGCRKEEQEEDDEE